MHPNARTPGDHIARSDLAALGWSPWFEAQLAEHDPVYRPARVVGDHGGRWTVSTGGSDALATVAGRLRNAGTRPAVGDWVLIAQSAGGHAVVHAVLKRRTSLSRAAAGEITTEQVLAANIDSIFIVSGLTEDLNLRRLERYLTVAWESGAQPAVVLTKADLIPDRAPQVHAVEEIARGVPILVVSGLTGEGLESLRSEIAHGTTAVFVGSSGVGKSTLINRLLGHELLRTASTRKDGRGRHTTSSRQLLRVPGGGLIIDTPGLRELQLWAGDESLERTFDDLASVASACRFRDCRHQGEPGCAVAAAIEDGQLPAERLASYRKLERELRALERRTSVRLQQEERKRWKAIHKVARERSRPG